MLNFYGTIKNNRMLRTLTKSDLNELLAIENAVHVAPWSADIFQICFEARYQGWGIEFENKLLGFIILSLHIDECHILNLGVAREHQQQGYGQQLLEYALDYAKKNGKQIAYLEVRRSNTRAIKLYRKMHFYLVGERSNYYQTVVGYEDALIFAKIL